jgi:hypothetical protein
MPQTNDTPKRYAAQHDVVIVADPDRPEIIASKLLVSLFESTVWLKDVDVRIHDALLQGKAGILFDRLGLLMVMPMDQTEGLEKKCD